MPEVQNVNSRISHLIDFSRRLIDGEDGKALIGKHRDVLATVTPLETMQVLDNLLESGIPHETVKINVGKLLNVFHKSLSTFQWEKPGAGHFLHYLMLENREAEKILDEVKNLNKQIFKGSLEPDQGLISNLKTLMNRLRDFNLHYIKKENILFPHIERSFSQYRCLQLMWSFHDDFRRTLRIITMNLEDSYPDLELLNREIGKLFFTVLPVIFREEQVVFPVALEMIPGNQWEEMMEESHSQGWCYIEAPERRLPGTGISETKGKINLGSGMISAQQVRLIFNHLPVDITYIDENDEVKYFSESRERIFPRSRAVIGRKVQNCHPPESVHIVNEIIEAFRSGHKDHADFWIKMKGRFIYIRYFAVRSDDGRYMGTLEVSQDITEARELSNERRLLNWEN